MTVSTKVLEVKTKQRKPKEAGTEPPELMGPAHSLSTQVRTHVGNSNPARREILLGCNICFLTKNPLFGRCRVHWCKGRINSLKPEGHFSFVCLVVSPWLLWEGVFKWEGWCKITRKSCQTAWLKTQGIWPLRAACFCSVGSMESRDPAFLLQRVRSQAKTQTTGFLVPSPFQVPKFTCIRTRWGLTLPQALSRQRQPTQLLLAARGSLLCIGFKSL